VIDEALRAPRFKIPSDQCQKYRAKTKERSPVADDVHDHEERP